MGEDTAKRHVMRHAVALLVSASGFSAYVKTHSLTFGGSFVDRPRAGEAVHFAGNVLTPIPDNRLFSAPKL